MLMTYLVIVLLLLVSGLFSGLNLGLMSLEPNELKRKAKLGNAEAAKIYPLRSKGNQLLVTLIVANIAANSTLAIFLDSITSGIIAGLLSTLLITLFGEILPQSIFSRFALSFGAKTAWFVQLALTVLSPICKPIAWILDKTLGEELPTIYSKKELIEILEEHGTSTASDIKKDEEKIASGALSFGTELVKDAMTPRSVVVSLRGDLILGEEVTEKLTKHGYSRFPVLDEAGNNVRGILYAYKLIGKDAAKKRISELMDHSVHYLNEDETLDKALAAFIKTKHHMFVVVNKFSDYVGILTLEDILEEIIGEEIVDEFDEYKDLRKVAEKLAKEPQGESHSN